MDWSAAALMVAALGDVSGDPNAISPMQFAQLTVRREIMLRIPIRVRPSGPPVPKGAQSMPAGNRIEWEEKRGPKCVAGRSIVAATGLGHKSVDLILRDRTRVRAKLERSCPALDYYYGFYVTPSPDGQICADRDAIRSRVGGECGIDRFRKLKATLKD
jgi:hypothetical protein